MLYIVPTPIGNLRDITLRAVDVLKEADVVLCEDTRRAKILLNEYRIFEQGGGVSLESFHENNERGRVSRVIEMLEGGKKVALISESGMPLMSDPGYPLVREVIRKGLPFEVLPGANAALTALLGSGLAVDAFSFLGFLPSKSAARRRLLTKIRDREETLIFYESPYRVLKALEDLREILGDREAVVAREMTKKFEEFVRGRLSGIIERFSKGKVLGEFVILVSGAGRKSVLSEEVRSAK